ncbi:NAD(P)/FAD-dependent oxidoreductase [Candidatus Poriferisocius sp.]|uniref:NAD(P)/FAD-dependent oxidoreductase n=1 Tax=Candidatus Poriferisocius sp. TaxID=3101276 RepID=UPI003B5261BB
MYWSDRDDAPAPAAALSGTMEADLAVIGGGFTGLWAALQALEDQPGMRVAVLEAEQCGFGASSRNGGFCDSSLTHGLANGLSHWPAEIETLVRLGRENLAGLAASLKQHGVDADFRLCPEIGVATEPWHWEGLEEDIEVYRAFGEDVELLDADQMRARVHSPTYLGGMIRRNDVALVDPARLVWGLRSAVEVLGGGVFDHSPVLSVNRVGSRLSIRTPNGRVLADRAVMATNAYPGPVRRPRRYTIPVYDHVLMTEPLSAEQMASVGWAEREGLGDVSNQFHYYRLSADNRILWGGYDATYHFNNGVDARHDQSKTTHLRLAEHFFQTFPQLEGLSFSHRWGGPIGTTTRFTATWGTACRGRLAWVAGYTGLGVGASRFGARVALDLVYGQSTGRTELEMVRRHPVPFPPEPARWASVQITRKALQRSDRRSGKRGAWLRLLDRFGVGFDS